MSRPLTDPLRETLDVFEATDAGTPLTTSEVAEAVDVGRRSTYDRLDRLVERGELETKEVGARGRVWWKPPTTDHAPADPPHERGDDWFQSVFEHSNDAIFIFDPYDDEILDVNPAACEMLGYTREELSSLGPSHVHPDELEEFRSFVDGVFREGSGWTDELTCRGKDGNRHPAEISASTITVDGEEHLLASVRDVSARAERERERRESERRFRTLAENLEEIVWMTSADPTDFLYLNPAYERVWDQPRERLYEGDGFAFLEAIHPDDRERVREAYAALPEVGYEEEFRVVQPDGSVRWIHATGVPIRDDDDEVYRIVGIAEDVTERKEREQELEQRVRQQEVITGLGQCALEERDLDGLMSSAVEAVADTLDNDYCKVLDLDDEGETLLLREGVGWDEGVVGETTVSAVEDDSQAAYTLSTEQPVVVEDLDTESRFRGPDLLRNHDVHSGISVVIGHHDDPWGILTTHDTEPTSFSENDVAFVQAVANVLANAIDRHAYEGELERQREQLAALNKLNRVGREITEAVIDQPTREEVERRVCEAFATSDSYEFAWLAEVDPVTEAIEERVEVGVDGYVDDISLSTDADDPTGRGPTGKTIRTHEVSVVKDAFADPDFAAWRDVAREYGYRASAAIPIVHEGTMYGVVGVYTAREDAFLEEEQQLLSQLGETVGHAIAAIERKRALMSDEVVKLEFRISDVYDALGVDTPTADRIDVSETVPLSDGDYLVYGTTSEGDIETAHALVEAIPAWKSVTPVGDADGEGPTRFQLRLADPPILSEIASRGGSVEEAVIEDGDYHMTFHLSPSVDTRQVIDAVRDAYPTTEMLSRRRIQRPEGDDARTEAVDPALTDRQRTALEAAFFGGFFEWPRESTGEEVADAMGVSAPTFHQHLRTAERKVLKEFVDEGPEFERPLSDREP